MQNVLERYGVAIVVGSAVTVGLLYLMQAVISNEKVPVDEDTGFEIIEIVRLLEDVEPVRKTPENKPPPPPDEMPPDIPFTKPQIGGTDWSPEVIKPRGPAGPDTNIGGYSTDGEYLPIVKVQPKYPRTPLQRGIEGYVIVQFTVTENGTVEDPVVVESDPPGMFDRAAINAALKFKYKPRVIDGKPIRVSGVKNRIVFELEEEP